MKMYKTVAVLLSCAMLSAIFSACGGGEQKVESEQNTEITPGIEQQYSIGLESFQGAEISTVCDELKEYLNARSKEEQLSYLVKYSNLPLHKSNVRFEWTGDGSRKYTVHFSTGKSFKKEITFETTNQSLPDSAKLIPGTKYYWKVTGDIPGSESEVDSFIYSSEPVRIIDVEGAQNIRDLGGWKTTDGKTVRFGKLFRGGRINSLGEEGASVFKDDLAVRTELDLRGDRDDGGQRFCAFDSAANYIKVDLSQYCYILPQFRQDSPVSREYDNSTPEKIKAIFSCLAQERNYPIYFHCNAGADRTGTVAFLLNGLLGVPYEDLVRDFELTSFSYSGKRWRGAISENGEQISDVMQDDAGNYVAFEKMYCMMMQYYGTESGELKDAIENYLTKICGVTSAEIASIRSIVLG